LDQEWGGAKREINTGDVVWIAAGVKHWHGATATTEMSHLAIQETVDGKNVNWLEPVSAAQYASPLSRRLTGASMQSDTQLVIAALDRYTNDTLLGKVWQRTELSPRDRSIVTLSALITRNQTLELSFYLNRALDSGVKPGEIAEIITHLAFYSGWPNAMAAAAVAKDVFTQRGVRPAQLPIASPKLLPMDQAAEERRASSVQQDAAPVSPGLVQYTSEVVFHDLWLRPDLAPRDRSLVTVAALIASGQVAQITFHLNKAMDNGLTASEAGEVLTQLAFYAGWPNAFSAVPVFKSVLESRSK
jgi:4-carboxymuconolactone decarboxylase